MRHQSENQVREEKQVGSLGQLCMLSPVLLDRSSVLIDLLLKNYIVNDGKDLVAKQVDLANVDETRMPNVENWKINFFLRRGNSKHSHCPDTGAIITKDQEHVGCQRHSKQLASGVPKVHNGGCL
jgi:hypothetical protein